MAAERENLNRIRSLLKFHPRGLTISDISQRLKLNRNSVAKDLEILEMSGCIEMHQMGAAKVFSLSQRIPLAAILGFTKEGIVVINEEERIVQVNERFCQMFDLNQNEILSASIASLPKNLNKILNSPRLFDEPDDKSDHTRILRMDQYDWTQYYKVRILNTIFDTGEKGKTVIIEDITLEKEMEERLRINEARYRGIVEDQIEMICRCNPEGKITFVNDAFTKKLAIKGDVIGRSIQMFIPSESFTHIQTGMKICTQDNPVWDLEIEITLPSGEQRWQHWIYRGIFNGPESPVEFQGVGQDITDRKRAELELLIKSCAIESSIMPIGLATLEGIITYVNSSFLEIWRYSHRSDVIGLPIEHFAHGDVEALKCIFQIRQIISRDASFSGEIRGVRRDGNHFNLFVCASVVKDTVGTPLCLIIYLSDVTNQVRLTREVQMKETAISHSYEGVAIICPDETIRYTNPSFSRIFRKLPEKNMQGRLIGDVYSSYPQLAWRSQEISDALGQIGTWTSVISDISDDGRTSIIQINLSLSRDDAGNQICTIFSALDITEQRMIEESLMMMYNHLKEAVEQVGDPSFILDNQQHVVAWNNAMVALTGFNRDEIIGTSQYRKACTQFEPAIPLLADLIDLPVRDLIRHYPQVSRFGLGLFSESFVQTLHGGKGALIWAKASPILNASGNTIGVIQTMKDMTNWKKIAQREVDRGHIT
ncbi:MAG: PAS domain S-box protein [Methanobacteriota archaeon]